jgi:hypothetical protein
VGARVLLPLNQKRGNGDRCVIFERSWRLDDDPEFERDLGNGRDDCALEALGRQPPAPTSEPIAHESCCCRAIVAVGDPAEHSLAELLDLAPIRPSLLAQEMKRDGFDKGEALHPVSEPPRRLQRQRSALGVADKVQRASRLFGYCRHYVEIGFGIERLAPAMVPSSHSR